MGSFAQGALVEQVTSVVTTGGITTLTSASLTYQKFTGTLSQTVVLPSATTMKVGRRFQFDSRTVGIVTINYASGGFATDVLPYTGKALVLVDNSTPDGVWTISVGADTQEPLKLSQAPGTPDSRLFVSSSQVRAEDGTTKTSSPLGSLLPLYLETTIDFQTAVTSGGTVYRDGGAFSLPTSTIGEYIRVVLVYNGDTNAVDTTFSAPAVSQGALTPPGTLFALISGTPLGYLDLVATASTAYKSATSVANVIDNFCIYKATNSGVPPLATATVPGLVSTTTQTFAGAKTFNDATTFKASAGTIAAGGYDAAGQWVLGDNTTALPVTIKGSGSSNLLTLQTYAANDGVIELIGNVGAANNAILKLTSGASGNGILRLGHAAAGLKIQNSSALDLASMASAGAWTFPISIETPHVILTSGGTAATRKITLAGTTWQIGGTASTITEAGNANFLSLQLTSGGIAASTKITLSSTTWQIGGTASTITEAGVGSFGTSVGTPVLQLTSGGASGAGKLTLSSTTWQIGGTSSTITEAGASAFATSVDSPVIKNTAATALSIQSAASQSILFAAGGTPAGEHASISPLGVLSILVDISHLCVGNLTFPTSRGIESSVAAATLNVGAGTNTASLNLGSGASVSTVNIGTGAAVTTINIGNVGDTVNIPGTQVIGSTTVNGNLNVVGNGQGIVPLGAIIAITSGFAGAMAVPSTGVVSNGYMRCDGAAIPVSQTLSGTTPNLSSSIYLRGSSTYGGTGGTNTVTLGVGNLPSHTHSIDHLHNSAVTLANLQDHTHPMNHDHGSFVTASGGSHTHTLIVRGSLSNGNHTSTVTVAAGEFDTPNTPSTWLTNSAGSSHTHTIDVPALIQDTNVSSNTHTHNVDVGNYTGSSGSAGSGTAFGIEPNYINVIYLMRVK